MGRDVGEVEKNIFPSDGGGKSSAVFAQTLINETREQSEDLAPPRVLKWKTEGVRVQKRMTFSHPLRVPGSGGEGCPGEDFTGRREMQKNFAFTVERGMKRKHSNLDLHTQK
ncbi:hypothetical protein TNIN_313011 [Trichonephila inaurata madagascariensis]|uniref:Uncharacterized protein n=1 Tax=Trichonephila inaurata madagascariensis TaxID=2747483 RepID=A0A8X6Y7S5_9ARAC|nr:hypothetical protein TNIN_313011 [Trichonephila inaurata madagascariensis]